MAISKKQSGKPLENDYEAGTGNAKAAHSPITGEEGAVELESFLDGIASGDLITVDRVAPWDDSGYLGQFPWESGVDIIDELKRCYGGGTYKIKIKRQSQNGRIVWAKGSRTVKIAGEPKRSVPETGVLAVPAYQPAALGAVELQERLFNLLSQQLGNKTEDLSALVSNIVQTVNGKSTPAPSQGDAVDNLVKSVETARKLNGLLNPTPVASEEEEEEEEEEEKPRRQTKGNMMEQMMMMMMMKMMGGNAPEQPKGPPQKALQGARSPEVLADRKKSSERAQNRIRRGAPPFDYDPRITHPPLGFRYDAGRWVNIRTGIAWFWDYGANDWRTMQEGPVKLVADGQGPVFARPHVDRMPRQGNYDLDGPSDIPQDRLRPGRDERGENAVPNRMPAQFKLDEMPSTRIESDGTKVAFSHQKGAPVSAPSHDAGKNEPKGTWEQDSSGAYFKPARQDKGEVASCPHAIVGTDTFGNNYCESCRMVFKPKGVGVVTIETCPRCKGNPLVHAMGEDECGLCKGKGKVRVRKATPNLKVTEPMAFEGHLHEREWEKTKNPSCDKCGSDDTHYVDGGDCWECHACHNTFAHGVGPEGEEEEEGDGNIRSEVRSRGVPSEEETEEDDGRCETCFGVGTVESFDPDLGLVTRVDCEDCEGSGVASEDDDPTPEEWVEEFDAMDNAEKAETLRRLAERLNVPAEMVAGLLPVNGDGDA